MSRIVVECATHTRIASYEATGGATLTEVAFTIESGCYVARRFWRAETGSRGVEIYVVDPIAGAERFVGYANPHGCPTDRQACEAIERTWWSHATDPARRPARTEDDTAARYDAIELSEIDDPATAMQCDPMWF